MKTKILALVLGAILTIPCVLRAEEVEIQLTEVVGMSIIPGDGPLDGPDTEGTTPTRPAGFRAYLFSTTINGQVYSKRFYKR